MTVNTVGYALSIIIAIAIIVIGVRFLLAPQVAAAGYGVPDERGNAYLAVKSVRDMTFGLVAFLLIVSHATHLLGWFMAIAAIIPVADALIVLRSGGSKAVAYGVHGTTAVIMLATAALLLI